MRKMALLFLLLPLVTNMLIAEDQTTTEKAAETGITSSNELFLQTSSLPEIKLGFIKRFSFPFLQGESPLTEGNNIGLNLSAEISPVSINGIVEAIWTPIAFFQFAAGGRIGTGWSLDLFGSEIHGIGLNGADAAGNAKYDGSAFDGLLWKMQTGGALQADLAAVFPGDWHHVVIRSYHEIGYKGYSRAAKNESWYFEDDAGENCNGFNYYGNLVIGYQMPIFLDFVALLAEANLYLYDTPDRSRWGDEKIQWRFSTILNFTITERISVAVITQFITQRNYVESNWEDLYYRNRTIDDSDPLSLRFFRVAAALTYKL